VKGSEEEKHEDSDSQNSGELQKGRNMNPQSVIDFTCRDNADASLRNSISGKDSGLTRNQFLMNSFVYESHNR